MAGEKLIQFIQEQGGKDSDYADLLYGTVLSISPLSVKADTGMELTSEFLNTGKYNKPRTVLIDNEEKTIIEPLNVGDSVSLIRGHKGQRFYILDRV